MGAAAQCPGQPALHKPSCAKQLRPAPEPLPTEMLPSYPLPGPVLAGGFPMRAFPPVCSVRS